MRTLRRQSADYYQALLFTRPMPRLQFKPGVRYGACYSELASHLKDSDDGRDAAESGYELAGMFVECLHGDSG